jgi:hypothetical protein
MFMVISVYNWLVKKVLRVVAGAAVWHSQLFAWLSKVLGLGVGGRG